MLCSNCAAGWRICIKRSLTIKFNCMYHYFQKKRNWFVIVPVVLIVVTLVAFLIGWIVMKLWNAILPPVLGLHMITYWQAVGILVLSRILFGGFSKGGSRRRGGPYMWKEKWMNMSDEEKLKFQEEWKRRCGFGYSNPPAETKEQPGE